MIVDFKIMKCQNVLACPPLRGAIVLFYLKIDASQCSCCQNKFTIGEYKIQYKEKMAFAKLVRFVSAARLSFHY